MATWSSVNTTQSPSWQVVSTGLLEFTSLNPFATNAFAESAFADGVKSTVWGNVSTEQTPVWTLIST
jgi:hypothetical protein